MRQRFVGAPALAHTADRLEHEGCLLDRVDGSALAPVRLLDLGVAGTAGNGDLRVARAAAGDPDVEAGRLENDPGVGLDAVPGASRRAGAGGLLVGVRADEEVAGQTDSLRGQRLGGDRHGCDAALHVAGAPSVQVPVAHLGAVRIRRPTLARLGRDGVDVAVQEEAAAAPGSAKPRRELGTALEIETLGNEPLTGELRRIWLPDVDLGSRGAEAPAQVLLESGLVAGRISDVPRRRVEVDQIACEGDQIRSPCGDRVDDPLLSVVQRHACDLDGSRPTR